MAVAQEGLAKVTQDDFSGGAFQGRARPLIPPTGLYAASNALFDEDAACYKRGGSEYVAAAAVGTSLRMIWDGVLSVGARTLVGNTEDYAVLNAGDTAFVNIGGPGMLEPQRATVFDGMLILDDGSVYGGSRNPTNLGGSTVTVTQGSKTVTATGTPGFLTALDAGMLFRVNSPATGRFYVVESVDSNTQVTLKDAYMEATAAGLVYSFTTYGNVSDNATGYVQATGGYAAIFNRLLAAAGRTVYFSGGRQADGSVLHSFAVDTDQHEFSGTVLGIVPLRDLVFVFTTDGVFVISGMADDLLDPDGVNFQQQVEPVNSDLILWGRPGIATYQNQMLIPGVDGLWAMGPATSPGLLSKSIQQRWRDHVHAGYKPGLATVFRNHYQLPVLNATNEVVDYLVCRLDRPQSSPIGTIFPWSWWTGQAANTPALTTRISGSSARAPKLLAADRATGRVLDLTSTFEPDDSNAVEADASTIEWRVILRDYATGDGNLNHVRRLRIRYELITVVDGPETSIQGFVGTGEDTGVGARYGEAVYDTDTYGDPTAAEFTQLEGGAPPDPGGTHPHTWHFNKRARHVRALLSSTVPSSRCILRSAEWYIRPSGNDR
jgi:hypothetical protein